MTEILTLELIKGSINPVIGLTMLIFGLLATDVLKIQELPYMPDFVRNNKAWVVFVVTLPFAITYLIVGYHWQDVVLTYGATNTLYALFIKPLKQYLDEQKTTS